MTMTLSGFPKPTLLLDLPTEIHAAVLPWLQFLDLQTLRMVNHYFQDLIDPVRIPLPTHAELLSAEKTTRFKHRCFACVGCTRLRPISKFSKKMIRKGKAPGSGQAHSRFCIECGRRDLPGLHRYMLGSRWDDDDIPYVRCIRCKTIARGPEEKAVQLCLSCHRQDSESEKARAAEELKRIQTEIKEQVNMRILRAERRIAWVESGRAMSDFSSEDSESERDDWEYDGGYGWDGDNSFCYNSS
ncbi:uncharacterized protein RSE6_00555 [Rhynchosporium secalis]|uniref:F-box domain-containing protein n=1 Tax=Rhynchosporium secalis TaxID=38038 RepID=A0A1E1LVI5_RHYSE|nr:uncharacterized protein RSE6_00555 [Rhynchosporium secalis]